MNADLTGSEGFKVPEILAALDALDVETIAMIRKPDRRMLGQVPGQVTLIDPLPHSLVLPACDAIVHHGGAGTMLTAACYGIPQVIVAPVLDQVFNASLLARTGAGVALVADQVDADAVKAAAASAISDQPMRDAAARVRDEIAAQPAPASLVRHLEPRTVRPATQVLLRAAALCFTCRQLRRFRPRAQRSSGHS
jgi:UDP:flavonoid glycosyltransferase YjiC (YdhE family)